jgi:hypothetical protein
MNVQKRLVALVLFGAFAAACGGPAEPKSPDEKLAEDESKLQDMEKEGGGQGTELDARDVEADEKAAEEEQSEEAPAEAPDGY